MKENSRRNQMIFQLWWKQKMTPEQIADMEFESNLSLRRVRNIVYAGIGRVANDHERRIYGTFRIKFLELEDIPAAIAYAHAHQPCIKYTARTIRMVIQRELEKRNQKQRAV